VNKRICKKVSLPIIQDQNTVANFPRRIKSKRL